MTIRIAITLAMSAFSAAAVAAEAPHPIKNAVVFQEAGRFGGWPANHGFWSWGNEILVGFEAGYFKDKAQGHAIDYNRPAEHVLARSLDGGETWTIERPAGLRPPDQRRSVGQVAIARTRATSRSPSTLGSST